MKYIHTFLYISTYLCIHVDALLYNENATILPWKPHNSSQVGQSLIYNGTYYLTDRDNAIIHVIDLANHHQRTIKGFNGKPVKKGSSTSTTTTAATATSTTALLNSQLGNAQLSPGLRDSLATAGPNGIILLPDRNELYVADANSTVRVINLKHKKKKKVAKISTGGQLPTEQLAYSPRSGLVMVTNPLEYPEHPSFVSIINATSRRVLGRVEMPHAIGTMQQPAWDSTTDKFYISIRATAANPGGEIDEIDPLTLKITNIISLDSCPPSGITFGPDRNLFVGCSRAQIPTYGYGYSIVLDMASNGSIVGNISGVSGVGQVVYDPSANLYYAAAYRNLATTPGGGIGAGEEQRYTPTPQVAIINASTNSLIQSIRTGNITSHTVAVDPKTKQMVIPIKRQGIAVYNVNNSAALSSLRAARQLLDFPTTGKETVSSASMARLSFGVWVVLFVGMMFL